MLPDRSFLALLAGAAFAVSASMAPSAHAQGLLGIAKEGSRVQESIPLKVGVGAWAGYDSNANTSADGTREETAVYGARATLRHAYVTPNTRFDLRFRFAGLYQEAGGGSLDDFVYNTRLAADFSHRVNDRVAVVNNALIAWEVEPDFMIGASSALRDDQYLYFWNRVALWFSITNRLTSVSSYAIEGIGYESDTLSDTEDRLTHTFGQQIRFAWSSQTTTKVEYRYGIHDFDSAPSDSDSHHLLAGIDQQFGDTLLLTVLAGAEYRDFEEGGAFWKPYAEASLENHIGDRTILAWLLRAGVEDTEFFGYDHRYAIRTGVTVNHSITERLGVSAGVAYVYSELDGDKKSGTSDIDEQGVQANADVTYALLPNLDISAGYQFTYYDSDDPDRNYDRHRIGVGASTTF